MVAAWPPSRENSACSTGAFSGARRACAVNPASLRREGTWSSGPSTRPILSRLRPVLGNVIFALMLATLMIPATVLVVPQYVTIADLPLLHLNLIGSPEAIWLPSVANAFNIFLLKRFFDSIPGDLLSAAAIDGASPLRTLRSVVLPISRPIIGVVSIFSLVAVWKDFLWPLLVEYGYNPNRETLNVGIFEAASTTPQNLVLAASAMAAVPTLVFFLIFQRNILSGLTAGSLKG